MASNDSNPTVTPEQPQTDAALKIKDPSTVDDTATYHYDPSNAGFSITSTFSTFTQDISSVDTPAPFPGSNTKYAPTTSPFILEVNGTGFNVSTQTSEPLKVYAIINGYIAVIPLLPSSTNLKAGNAFGYIVKSATKLWIYLNRPVFQKIWFTYDSKTFKGDESASKDQIESATNKYPLLGAVKTLTIQVAVNKGLTNDVNYFVINGFKSVSVSLTQSPYIITLQGRELNGSTYPNVIPNSDSNSQPLELIYLYGHDLNGRKVMMVKTSSSLLKNNPSALPQTVLDSDQSATTIANTKAQALASLEYFKIGNFLGPIDEFTPKSKLLNYSYFTADGTKTTSGKTGPLPQDPISTVQFKIITLPASAYNVVVYDPTTGSYSVAPVQITINLAAGNLQIHDVSPQTAVLQSPSFTVNGFNFPVADDINNGAVFTVSLVDSNQTQSVSGHGVSALFTQAFLQIDKTSPTNSKNGFGSITLSSNSQFTAKFTSLHVTEVDLVTLSDTTFKLRVEVTYEKPNPSQGKINEAVLSGILQIQEQPVISFLTNTIANPPDNAYSKSLVRVDQATGNVIAFGIPNTDGFLYIVGRHFNTGATPTVFLKGVQQTVLDSGSWSPNNFYDFVKIKANVSNIKGDATVEVRVGSASSEAYQFSTTFHSLAGIVTDAKGSHTKDAQTFETAAFRNVLPFNQLDQHTLLNSSNTKIASSVALRLSNKQTKESIQLNADLNSSVALPFLPDEITVPANTKTTATGDLSATFYFYNLYNVNISTPKIFRLQHGDGSFGGIFKPAEKMTVVGTGYVNGMRYNINKTGWTLAAPLGTIPIDNTIFQTFIITVPASSGSTDASLQVSNDQAAQVDSAATAGKSSGAYKVGTIIVNDRYSPLLKINQRLPAGIKMYAKGPQVGMTDKIDANMSIYSQMTPFLGSFKTLLIVIRIIVCIIDVICALINPFQLIVAIIALMDCIIDLLSLFPQLAVPIMILSFLQNFVGFLLTFIQQIETYVFSIVNSQLALVEAQISKDFALLAAAEQQAFGATKQIRDVIAFLEPALQIIQIFKDLLAFAMHFPCSGNQGGTQANGKCPPPNIAAMISGADDPTDVEGMIEKLPVIGSLMGDPGFFGGPGSENEGNNPTNTLSTMFCQAVAIQTATLQTMPGFNGLDNFGNPLPGGPLLPGSTSVVPNVNPVLPNVAAAIECMNNLTDNIENALNAGQTYITTPEQGQQLVSAYIQCVQNLIDQTNQSLGDVCVLAVSAINSELKVSPKGRVGPDLTDDFIRTKIPLPSTQPNDAAQDAGLVLDLAKLKTPSDLPPSITSDPSATTNGGAGSNITGPVTTQVANADGTTSTPAPPDQSKDQFDGSETVITTTTGQKIVDIASPIPGNYVIYAYYRVTGSTSVTLSAVVNWTDAAGQQSSTIIASGSRAAGSYTVSPLYVNVNESGPLQVIVTADTIGAVYVSATASIPEIELPLDEIKSATATNSVSATADSVTVVSTANFPAVGLIKLDSEFIVYTGKTANTFIGLTRGALGTLATIHVLGADITQLTDPAVLAEAGVNDILSAMKTQTSGTSSSTSSTSASTTTNTETGTSTTGASDVTLNFGLKRDIFTPIIFQSTNKSGQRQGIDTIYFNADNSDVGDLIVPGDILEIVGGTFSGLQFPIIGIQKIFTAVRLTCKLDITFEQRLLIGEQPLPGNLSGFDVKIIAHLAGNDAVAVVPADDLSVATVQILARDHHGHEIGTGLANKVAITIESGTAVFVPAIPSSTTDITGVIQEQGTHYIANLKANCSGIVIVSSSVCGVEFVDIGYHANDPNHAITTRKKTVKIIFIPPIPIPVPNAFSTIARGQVPGTHFVN